jgi:hypothetical protein
MPGSPLTVDLMTAVFTWTLTPLLRSSLTAVVAASQEPWYLLTLS